MPSAPYRGDTTLLTGDQLFNYCLQRIKSTKEMRRSPKLKCSGKDQRCHIVGLNLIKEIFNGNQHQCRLVTATELARTIDALAEVSNFVCCSVKENRHDVRVEHVLLNAYFGREQRLSREARAMLIATIKLLNHVQQELDLVHGKSISFTDILHRLDQLLSLPYS